MKNISTSEQPVDQHQADCLCSSCLTRQFDKLSWRERDGIARRIIFSAVDISRLTPESRHLLREALSLGYAPQKDREALASLLNAELLEKIPSDKLLTDEYRPGCVIKGAVDFNEKVKAQLDSLAEIPLGEALLRSLAGSSRIVTIVASERSNDARPDNYRAAVAPGKALRWRDESGMERMIRGNGKGSDTTIRYNPDLSKIGSNEAWQRQPPAIWLAHELIHADDAAYGRMDPEFTDGLRNYERQAIGLPPYEQKEFTENKIRAAWVEPQPLRPRY